MIKKTILALLRFYKKWVSPLLGQRCRFEPTCSMYMYEAVQTHGAAKGVWLGLKRLSRCQPCYRGDWYDPVP